MKQHETGQASGEHPEWDTVPGTIHQEPDLQDNKTLLRKSCWSVRYRPKHPYLWQSQCSSCETLRASNHASSWGPRKHDPRGHRLWMFCVFIVMNRTSFAGIIHLAEWIRSTVALVEECECCFRFHNNEIGRVLVIACIQYDGLATSECIPKG